MELHGAVEEYLTLVNQFHGWLDVTLEEHHRADLQELGRLQAELQARGFGGPQALQRPSGEEEGLLQLRRLNLQEARARRSTTFASDLFGRVRELKFQGRAQGFETGRLTISNHGQGDHWPDHLLGR